MDDNNEEREHESDRIDYKKAFQLLMISMLAKTLSPDGNNFGYGSPDMCIECMVKGRNFAYGDDGDKKLVCDKCPYNFTNAFRTKQMKGSEIG